MLELKEISKIYKKDKKKITALDNINFKFNNNGFYFINGKSGSGKSTLLNLIAKLEKPTTGEIKYSQNINISVVFQNDNLIGNFTVFDNLNLVSDDVNKINELLIKFQIADKRDIKVKYLSGGEQQRVAIIRSIIKDSNVLLFDEATANLDEEVSIQILDLIKEISNDRLVIFISHNYNLLSKYADVIIKLDKGKIVDVINNNDLSNDIDVINYKNNKSFSFKLILKYSLDLLLSRKVINIISIIILTFMLSALTVTLQFALYDDTKTILDSLENTNYIYLPIESVNQERTVLKGNVLASQAENEKVLPYLEVNSNDFYHNIYINDDIKEEIKGDSNKLVISSFLANYYFGDEEPIGKKISFNILNSSFTTSHIDLEVSGVFEVDYDKNMISDIENVNKNDISLKYGISYANVNYLTELIFNNGINLNGNVLLYDFGSNIKNYLLTKTTIYKDNNSILKNYNDVIIDSSYPTLSNILEITDLNQYPDYKFYNDSINLYDLTKEFKIVEEKDNINGFIVSDKLYNDIVSNYLYNLVSGLVISNNNINASRINLLKENSVTFNVEEYLLVYHFGNNLINSFGASVLTITFVLLIITICFNLYSTLNIYSKKEKEILILKSLNISRIKIIVPFLIMNLFIFILSFIISIPISNAILDSLANLMLNNIDYRIDLLYLNFNILMITIGIGLIFIILAIIMPFIKIMKKEINLGIKNA